MAIDVRGLAPLLQVFDMPTSVHFYCDVLGFDLVSTSRPGEHFDWALLRLNGIELMLNTAYESHERPPNPDSGRVAGHADTGLYFSCPDVDKAYLSLSSRGIVVEGPVTREYGMKQLSVMDPDGYHICLQWPTGDRIVPK